MSFRNWLAQLLLVAAAAAACACSGPDASSERRVLSSFDARDLRGGRVLLAPFSPASVDSKRSVPLDRAALDRIGKGRTGDRLTRALQAFYDAAADGVREAFDDADEELSLARVEDAKWSGYFDAPADFMNVTLDQKTRFEVPKVELLTRLGLNADIAIVFDEIRFSRSETLDSVDIGGTKSLRVARSLSCSAKFLVWDYGRHRPLAEGSVHADVGTGQDVELENWRELAEDMAAEVVSKRPFVRP